MGRAFSNSYLAGEPAAHAFFPVSFRDPARRSARARSAAGRTLAPALVRTLREQQAAWGNSHARQVNLNLDALASGNTAVVVTGQQVGLFLGPLYAFYKAASAIAIARALEKESGIRCVPLFWLQSEDHDFEEIRACNVAGPDGGLTTLSLPDELDGQGRASVAYRTLPAQVTPLLDDLEQLLPPGAAAGETLALLREHYQPGRSMVAAFARTLASVFAEDGLLLLDPRHEAIAELASPVYRRCLDDCLAIERILHERGEALIQAGFAEQVRVRDGGALIFFHREDVTGARMRMLKAATGTAWTLAGSDDAVSAAQIDQLLLRQPLRFSTSALVRPIVQDTLLPTVAYVGGPGEINYFAQVQPLYAHVGLEPPLLVPRARFRLLDARTRRRLVQLGFSADQAGEPADKLFQLLAGRSAATASVRDAIAGQILPAVQAVVGAVAQGADPGLQRLAERTRQRVTYHLDRLLARSARIEAEKDSTAMERLRKVQVALFPKGIPQERFYGWPWLSAQLGVAGGRGRVLDHLATHEPFPTGLQDLEV